MHDEMTGVSRETHDENRREELIRSLPPVDESTPLAAQIAADARRRIDLAGRRFARPPHTRILTIANQKGGVGKTSTAVNLAAALAQGGLDVLVIDSDPQGNASTALGVEHRAGTPSIYEVLIEDEELGRVVQSVPDVPRLSCVPATIDLSGAEIELVSLVARENRLRNAIQTYLDAPERWGRGRPDYVLIDCPPSLGLLTVNAFVAAREVLIPIQCEYYALEGLSQLLKNVELIKNHLNPALHVSTILLTMFDGRTNLAHQVADEVRQHFPGQTLSTTIPRSVRISEAPSFGQTVMTYDPGSSGALAYLAAAREVAERAATPAMPQNESGGLMAEKRRGLGKGLGALIPTTPSGDRPVDVFFPGAPAAGAEASAETRSASPGPNDITESDLLPVPGASFAELPISAIVPNPRQPRTVFDEEALEELTASIREVGVLQPIVVRPVGFDAKGDATYELIMGERRLRASQGAGSSTIPAIIRQTEDADLLRDALLENLHRSQLNPLEEAAAYQQLLDDFACTHEELASRIHRSRPQISNTLRLLKLPPLVQRRVAAGVLSAGHARALLGASDGAAIERLAQRIVAEGLSVRATEEAVAVGDAGAPITARKPRAGGRNRALDDLASRLADRWETRVKIDLGRTKGRLTVEFASVQDLNRILAEMAPDQAGVFPQDN